MDASLVRLTVAYNAVVERGLEPKLPADLARDAIPTQIVAHEAALTGRSGAAGSEAGAQGEAGAIYRKTERLLARSRYAVLASFEDADDPRIDEPPRRADRARAARARAKWLVGADRRRSRRWSAAFADRAA